MTLKPFRAEPEIIGSITIGEPVKLAVLCEIAAMEIPKHLIPGIELTVREVIYHEPTGTLELMASYDGVHGAAAIGLKLDLASRSFIELSCLVSPGGNIVVSDIFPDILADQVDEEWSGFNKNVASSALDRLTLYINSAKGFSIYIKGAFAGISGSIGLALTAKGGGVLPELSFNFLTGAPHLPRSIPEIITSVFGLGVSASVLSFLPSTRFAVSELIFDQPQRMFKLDGAIAQPGREDKDDCYIEGSLEVSWTNGIQLQLSLDAGKAPVKIVSIEQGFPFSLDGIRKVLPENTVKKIEATAFNSFAIRIDTEEQLLSIEGGVNLFGRLLASGIFSFSRADGLAFRVNTYGDPVSFNELFSLLGLEINHAALPALKIRLDEMSFYQSQSRFSIIGTVQGAKGSASIGLEIQVVQKNVYISFDYFSNELARLTAGDLITSSLPASFREMLPGNALGENKLLTSLKNSSLTELQMNLDTGDKEFSFYARGEVLRMRGELGFSILNVEGAHRVFFQLYGDEKQNLKSIQDILQDTLGLPVPAYVSSCLPKIELALTELSFNQPEYQFRLGGVTSSSGYATTEKGFKLDGSIWVSWLDGIKMGIELDATHAPISIGAALMALPVASAEVVNLLPQKLESGIKFFDLSIAFDGPEEKIEVKSAVQIFETIVLAGISVFRENGATFFIMHATIDRVSLKEIVEKTHDTTLPSGIPDLIFLDLNFEINTKTKSLHFSGVSSLTSSIKLGDINLSLTLGIDVIYSKISGLSGKFSGTAQLPGVDLDAVYVTGADSNLALRLAKGSQSVEQGIHIDRFVTLFLPGIEIPKEVPEVLIESLIGSIDLNTYAFVFDGKTRINWDFLQNGNSAESTVSVHLEKKVTDKKNTWHCALKLETSGILKITDEVFFENIVLEFEFVNGEWRAGGDMAVRVFGTKFNFAAAIETGARGRHLTFSGNIEINGYEFKPRLKYIQNAAGSYALSAGLNYRSLDFDLAFIWGESYGIRGSLGRITVKDFTERLLGIDYPENLPNPELEDTALFMNSSGEISYAQRISIKGAEQISSGSLAIDALTVRFDRKRNNSAYFTSAAIAIDCRLDLEGVISFPNFQLNFRYDDAKGARQWTVDNHFTVEFFGIAIDLKAFYHNTADGQLLGFTVEGDMPKIGIGEVAEFSLERMDFRLTKERKKGSGNNEATVLILNARSNFKAGMLLLDELDTALIISAEKTGLALTASGAALDFGEVCPISFAFRKPALELIYTRASKTWSIGGSGEIHTKGVPETLKSIFPEQIGCFFKFSKTDALIGIDSRMMYPIPSFPSGTGADLGGISDLGQLYIGVGRLEIDLKKKELSTEFKLGLPLKTNELFKGRGDKVVEVFKVYNPDTKSETIGFTLSISEKGVSIMMNDSPFKELFKIQKVNGRSVVEINLGDYGSLSVELPRFTLSSDGSLKASGGFKIKDDLSLPLTPLIYLLEKIKLGDLAAKLKPKIPLRGIDFTEVQPDGSYHFSALKFIDLFADISTFVFPAWLKQGLEMINANLSKMPDGFLEYGNIEIPKQLFFEIDLSASGSLNCKFSTKDPDDPDARAIPLKLLIPQLPVFTGIKLYSFSLGELLGGSLFRVDIDAEVDFYDIPGLAASLLIDPESPAVKAYLPDLKMLRRKVRLKNLTTLIIYQTAIPIPVPLFYDEIGISALTIEGTELVSSFSFPMPVIGIKTLKDFGIIISQLVKLFKNGTAIDLEQLKKIELVTFTVGPNFIRLPKFIAKEKRSSPERPLEGKLLGTTTGFTIDPVSLFCTLAESIVTGSINKLVQLVDVKHRVGIVELDLFDVLHVEAKYALTTPYEFATVAYERLQLKHEAQQDFLGLLPAPLDYRQEAPEIRAPFTTTPEDEGLVLFMNGKINLPNLIEFDAGFGFAAISDGIGIGAQITGRLFALSNTPGTYAVDLSLQGIFAVKKRGFRLEGKGHLRLLGQPLLTGKVFLDKENLMLSGEAGQGGMPLHASGELLGKFRDDELLLKGDAKLVLLGFASSGKVWIQLNATEEIIDLSGTFNLADVVTLDVRIAYLKTTNSAAIGVNFNGRLGDILEMELSGDLAANGTSITANGNIALKILQNDVLKCAFAYKDERFVFAGMIDIFAGMDKKIIDLSGNVAGEISPKGFVVAGDAHFRVMNYTFSKTRFLATNDFLKLTATFFNYQAVLFAEQSDKLTVTGSLQPIQIGAHFSISAPVDKDVLTTLPKTVRDNFLGGPIVIVGGSSPYFMLRGEVKILGITTTVHEMVVKEEGFYLRASGNIFDLIRSELEVTWKTFNSSSSVMIRGTLYFEELSELINRNIRKVADDIRESLKKARKDLEDAKETVRKITEAATEKINESIAEFNIKIAEAQQFITERQREVDRISDIITTCYARIETLKNEIERKKEWFDRSPWILQCFRWIELTAYVAPRGIELGERYAVAGVFEGLKYAAIGLLEAAKEFMRGIQVLAQVVAEEAKNGLKLFRKAADDALTSAQDALVIITNTVGIFEEWSTSVIADAGDVLSIHGAEFYASLNNVEGGKVLVDVRLKFLNVDYRLEVGCSFYSIDQIVDSITLAVKARKMRPDAMAVQGREKNKPVMTVGREILDAYPQITASAMCVALLRGGYDRKSEVQDQVLKQFYIMDIKRKIDVREAAAAITAGLKFVAASNKLKEVK